MRFVGFDDHRVWRMMNTVLAIHAAYHALHSGTILACFEHMHSMWYYGGLSGLGHGHYFERYS